VTPVLCSTGALHSLFQFVIATTQEGATWPPHVGGVAPQLLFNAPGGFSLPGVRNGPSSSLASSTAWSQLMTAFREICDALGLRPGAESTWLSGLDPSVLTAAAVRRLVSAHRALVREADVIGGGDRFWASYPFSVVVVEGNQGAEFGQVQAVFLSPLHPVRLAWAFCVAALGRRNRIDDGS